MTSHEELEDLQAMLILCGRLIYREPDVGEIASLAGTGVFSVPLLDSPLCGKTPYVRMGLSRMEDWCLSCGASIPPEQAAALRREWLDLFVGLGKPKAPVWESYYTEPDRRMFGASTLEIREAYRRFGLQVERLRKEPDDNLGIMLGFLAHLVGRELEVENGRDTRWGVEELRAAQRDFLARHILPWVAAWRAAVGDAEPSSFYRGLADVTFGTVAAHAFRFGIRLAEGDRLRFVFETAEGCTSTRE